MKKLIIAAAIVCAAVCGQAAQFLWSASGVNGYGTGAGLYSGDATIHVLVGGAEKYSTSTTMSGGAISGVLVQSDSIPAGQVATIYYTMTDTAGNVFTSASRNMSLQATATPPINFLATGSWVAAPEPTSGLLLLLGVAGLALRRRRA